MSIRLEVGALETIIENLYSPEYTVA